MPVAAMGSHYRDYYQVAREYTLLIQLETRQRSDLRRISLKRIKLTLFKFKESILTGEQFFSICSFF